MQEKLKRITLDYLKLFEETNLNERYSELYAHEDVNISILLSKIHQELNRLLGFMNDKAKSNSHYNASESRELLQVINILGELKQYFKGTDYYFEIQNEYDQRLSICENFLTNSGGCHIPEDYEHFKLIKYDPIFFFTNTDITITDSSTTVKSHLIGEGAYAVVHKFKDPFYNKHFARKTLKRGHSEREKERFANEYKIMKGMSFPYILEVYSYDEQRQSYLMEYCDIDLERYISHEATLCFSIRKKIALQMLYGLNYIHSKNILHRDISYRNFLVKKYDGGAIHLKLSDFGLVKDLDNSDTKSDSAYKGSILDPTIDPSADKFKDYSIKNEIYPIGYLLQFIFTGRKGIDPLRRPSYLNDIIEKCTNTNLERRYNNVAEIIKEVEDLNEM